MKKLAYFFLFILCLGQSFDLRGQFIADRFTNRPLTLMNDATSVGWNPAVLGMTGKTDVVLVVPYDRSWQNTRLIGAFASSQGVGLGYTSVRHERLPDISYVPFSFYGGVGSKIPGYNVWAGASFRYSEFGGRTVRYSGSLIYNPYDKLYLSAGMSNLYSVDTRDMVYQASATYSLLDWLTMHGRLQYCAENPIFWGEKYSSEFGIVAAINKKRVITSFSVNPVAREARFGLEVAFDVFSIGILSEGSTLNTPSGRFTGGNILLRVNHDSIYAQEHYRVAKSECTVQNCNVNGCSGKRCVDAICPAYRCIKVDCQGKACTRSICTGLNCTHGHAIRTVTVTEKHTTCTQCSHPAHGGHVTGTHVSGTHISGGCELCGCKVDSHGAKNVTITIDRNTTIDARIKTDISNSNSTPVIGGGSTEGTTSGGAVTGGGSTEGTTSGGAVTGGGSTGGATSGGGSTEGTTSGGAQSGGESAGGGNTGGGNTGGAISGGEDAKGGESKGGNNDAPQVDEGNSKSGKAESGKPNNADAGKKSTPAGKPNDGKKGEPSKPNEEPVDDPEEFWGNDDSSSDDGKEAPTEGPSEEPETPDEITDEPEDENPFLEAEPISELYPNNPNDKSSGKKGPGKSYRLRRVFFDHDKWDIKPQSIEELNKLKSYLAKNPDLCVRLDAHTDSNGSNEYNKELSRKRAQSVVDYLIQNGIDPVRLSAQGFGEEFPVTTNDTSEGREENRRVEFTKIGC